MIESIRITAKPWKFMAIILAGSIISRTAGAAVIAQAHDFNGEPLAGITIEGDIEPGDATKLQNAVAEYDIIHEPNAADRIYLRSKGGDVAEAMKMGTYIRRMRLVTEVPIKLEGHESDRGSWVSPVSKDNDVCASACFLIYARGVDRLGNRLALHRPYLPRQIATGISDVEYEAAEKRVMTKVSEYLKDMEVDQFFINKMMANSSQDAYLVSLSETDEYHLSGIVPSIEEAVLTKCTVLTSQDKKAVDSPTTSQEERMKLLKKDEAGFDCEAKVLGEMRYDAFKREMANAAR